MFRLELSRVVGHVPAGNRRLVVDGAHKVRQLGLGADLQRLRKTSGMSTRSVAERLGVSRMAVSRTESGRRSVPPEEVIAMCALYGITGHERQRLVRQAGAGDRSSSWLVTGSARHDQVTSLAALENRASVITDVEMCLVPGLLQTSEYMWSLLAENPFQQWMAETRLWRQRVLVGSDAPEVRCLIEESVLRRPIGGRAVLRRQLEHLLEVGTNPHVSVRVLPMTAGMHSGLDGSFMLLQFPDGEPKAYVEAPGSGVILTRSHDVGPFVSNVDELGSLVLDERRSAVLIAEMAEELPHERGFLA